MKGIKKVCQLMERCDGHGEVVPHGRRDNCQKCDSHQGGVKGIRKVCQLMERCDGHLKGVKGCGEV